MGWFRKRDTSADTERMVRMGAYQAGMLVVNPPSVAGDIVIQAGDPPKEYILRSINKYVEMKYS